ncbi:transcription factor [Tasmannia lanceolata]|uniref:transcription factor n=1 Tax=Tasmannia lanceolata TaxID=3420 RepID=UPI004062CB9D
MMKSSGRKKSSRPFKDFYAEWFSHLKGTLLPLLRQSMSSATLLDSDILLISSSDLLSTHVHLLHTHFQSYFKALDLAALHDVSQLLYPDWRNPLEKPFLWLGDLHPNLFTHLLRSFINNPNYHNSCQPFPLPFVVAFKDPSEDLIGLIKQIECGLRVMAPALVSRSRDAQVGFVDRIGSDWVEGRVLEGLSGAVKDQMEELMSVFVDANRLRGSILAEIIDALDVYQSALYLEGLAQFLVGFKDAHLLRDFKQCGILLSPSP